VPEYHIELRPVLSIVLLGLLLAISACTAGQSYRNASPEYPTLPFRLESAHWSEPYAGPEGVPKGAQRAVLGTDPNSGGETYYAHFPAGSRFELHWHAYAEYAVVLRGKVTHILGKERFSLQAGDYVVIPPKVNHGWEVDPGSDVFLLIRRDGPADQHFVQR
jgi:quercetin dioxygenase-like cupin family protein